MKGKPAHIDATSPKPTYKFKSDSMWGTQVYLYRNTYLGFKAKTRYQRTQSVFGINEYASDYIPIHQFFDTKFVNVEEEAMAFFYTPPEEWANMDDCGNFPCTAPLNAMFSFQGTSYSG